jgi:hypothetical protein
MMPIVDEVMERLVSLAVLAVTSDPRSGSLFELGEWIQRPRRVPNPNLSETQQNCMGSASMFVRCRWELDSPVALVPRDAVLHGVEQRTRLLEAVVGSRIADADFSEARLELRIRFDNEMALLLLLSKPVNSMATLAARFLEMHWLVYADGGTRVEPRLSS